jgi:hypothetical protein
MTSPSTTIPADDHRLVIAGPGEVMGAGHAGWTLQRIECSRTALSVPPPPPQSAFEKTTARTVRLACA